MELLFFNDLDIHRKLVLPTKIYRNRRQPLYNDLPLREDFVPRADPVFMPVGTPNVWAYCMT